MKTLHTERPVVHDDIHRLTGLVEMQADAPAGTETYLPSLSLEDYLRDTVPAHPVLKSSVDFGRPGSDEALRALAATTTEFDSDETGRGDTYRRAQQDPSVRWKGMRQLLELAAPSRAPSDTAAPRTVLDVLGGDGTIARAVHDHAPDLCDRPHILTGDLSGDMVERALAQGLAAIRQAADHLFLGDGTMDAALLAYGTHHIAPQERLDAVTEALRVVKDGGNVVLHDFDDASPMARFFTDVVHPHTTAGHDYRHFSRGLLAELFAEAGTPARVVDLYDPLVVCGATREEARRRMCAYVADMYGVGAFFATLGGTDARWRLLEEYFRHDAYLSTLPEETGFTPAPVVYRSEGAFIAEVPRAAIVAVAHKPPA